MDIKPLVTLENEEKISQNTKIIQKFEERNALIESKKLYGEKMQRKYTVLFVVWFVLAFSFCQITIINNFPNYIFLLIFGIAFVALIALSASLSNFIAKYSKKDDNINTLDEEIKQLELQYKIDGLPEEKKLLLNSVLEDSELKEILKEKIL